MDRGRVYTGFFHLSAIFIFCVFAFHGNARELGAELFTSFSL